MLYFIKPKGWITEITFISSKWRVLFICLLRLFILYMDCLESLQAFNAEGHNPALTPASEFFVDCRRSRHTVFCLFVCFFINEIHSGHLGLQRSDLGFMGRALLEEIMAPLRTVPGHGNFFKCFMCCETPLTQILWDVIILLLQMKKLRHKDVK